MGKDVIGINMPKIFDFIGAGGRIRTAYLLITNQLLYRLSYAGQRQIKIRPSLNMGI